jgi:hypothetical protein
MVIVRQDLGNALPPHRHHRNAVGEAVPLILAGFVEADAGKEGLAGLGENDQGRVVQETSHRGRRLYPYLVAVGAEMIKELGQHLVGRHQGHGHELPADLNGPGVPLVFAVGECHPVEGVGEDAPHAVGRFGVP